MIPLTLPIRLCDYNLQDQMENNNENDKKQHFATFFLCSCTQSEMKMSVDMDSGLKMEQTEEVATIMLEMSPM